MNRFLFVFLTFLYFPSLAQNSFNYTQTHYSDANGLPQNSVKTIAKDDGGYLWLATEAGLTRFDGNNFLIIDKQTINTRSNRIFTIRKDLNTGFLYAQTEYHELIPIHKGKVYNTVPFKQIFFNLNPEKQVQEAPVTFLDKPKFRIEIAPHVFYYLTKDSLFFYGPKFTKTNIFKRKAQFNFFVSKNQLFHYEPDGKFTCIKNGITENIKLSGSIKAFTGLQAKDLKLVWNTVVDQAFICTNKAIYQIEYRENQLYTTLIVKDFDVIKKQIQSIYYDKKSKKLFVGSLTQGLFILQQHLFTAEKPQEDLSRSVKYALYPYNDHSVLFANGDLIQSNGHLTHLPLVKKYSKNFSISIDQQKNIWTLNDSSVYKLSADGKQLLQKFSVNEETNCTYIDKDQILWIGTAKGIYTKDLKRAEESSPVKLLNLKRVTAITKHHNLLQIGTYSGFYTYNFSYKKLYTISKMANISVRNILIRGTHKNEIWICTYGNGFYLLQGSKLKKMPVDKFAYLNNAHCILEDKNGFFWMSTNKGLFQVAVNDLLAYYRGQTKEVYYQYYNESYGFNINEFNGGCQPCAAQLKDGNFIFPSLIGSVMFKPNLIKANLPEQAIYIDKIIRDLKEIPIKDSIIIIDQGFAHLSISISSPYFGNPENQIITYKLANEANWIDLNASSIISYSHLPPGMHELRIRKPTGFNNQFTYKSLKIFVPPYFYQTWWFNVLLILSTFGAIFLFFKQRTQIISKRNMQLEAQIESRTRELKTQTIFQKKMIAAITHDIKTPLRYMMITGKQLCREEKISPKLEVGLHSIYHSANNMYFFTENLLNYSKLFLNDKPAKFEPTNLRDLINEKIKIFSDMALHQNNSVINEVPSHVVVTTNKVVMAVIIHNILDNAIKYTQHGTVSFKIQSSDRQTQLIIADNGPGMTTEMVNFINSKDSSFLENGTKGLGLKMVKEFSARIHLNIQVISKDGVSFELTFDQQATLNSFLI